MVEEELKFDFFKRLNDIKNNPKKMFLALVILIIILAALIYIAFFCKQITTLTFSDNCTETYVNGKINGSLCTESREKMEKQNNLNVDMPYTFNFTNDS